MFMLSCLLAGVLLGEPPICAPPGTPPILRSDRDELRMAVDLPVEPASLRYPYSIVAFIDTGIMADHPQLRGLVVREKDFTGEGLEDRTGHGTIVVMTYLRGAYTLGPEYGVNPIVSAKVASLNLPPTKQRLMDAIRWAASQGAEIINISLGIQGDAADFQDLCDLIESTPALFNVATGNRGSVFEFYPANCGVENLISIGTEDSAPAESVIASENATTFVGDPFYYAYSRGMALAKAHDLDGAEAMFKESIRLEENANALLQLSAIDLVRQHIDEARQKLEHCTKRFDDAGCHAQLAGLLLITGGSPAAAEAECRAALRLYPSGHTGRPLVRVNLAIALVRQQRLAEGRAELQALLRDDPTNAQAKELLANLDSLRH